MARHLPTRSSFSSSHLPRDRRPRPLRRHLQALAPPGVRRGRLHLQRLATPWPWRQIPAAARRRLLLPAWCRRNTLCPHGFRVAPVPRPPGAVTVAEHARRRRAARLLPHCGLQERPPRRRPPKRQTHQGPQALRLQPHDRRSARPAAPNRQGRRRALRVHGAHRRRLPVPGPGRRRHHAAAAAAILPRTTACSCCTTGATSPRSGATRRRTAAGARSAG
jgi:hypothetical protein